MSDQNPRPASPVVPELARFEAVLRYTDMDQYTLYWIRLGEERNDLVSPPHWGQTSGKTSYILAISIAQRDTA